MIELVLTVEQARAIEQSLAGGELAVRDPGGNVLGYFRAQGTGQSPPGDAVDETAAWQRTRFAIEYLRSLTQSTTRDGWRQIWRR